MSETNKKIPRVSSGDGTTDMAQKSAFALPGGRRTSARCLIFARDKDS